MEYPEREPHDKSISNQNPINDNENSDNNSVDYFDNEDEFLIIDEYNKKLNKEKNDDENEYNDENINPNDDENYEEDFDDKENNFKNSFLQYYHKYANEKLVVNLRQINEFKLFEIMMKDIELNDKNILNGILDKMIKAVGNNVLNIIEKFKGIQKIFFQNKNNFSYRKIVKIIRK